MAENFNKMRIWQIGYDLLMEIYEVASRFPDIEKYALVQQLIKAANSVIANIAESHGRYYYLDKIRVLYISRGEAQEVQSHLFVAVGQNYISQDKFDDLKKRYESLIIKINEQIIYLRSKSDK